MRVLGAHDQEVAAWAGAVLGVAFQEPYTAFGVIDRTGVVQGAAIFNDYYPGGNVELTYVGSNSFSKGVFRFLCRFAFDELKATRVTARTRRGNVVMRRMLPKGGFNFEGTQKHFYGPTKADDALVYVLFRHNAERWLGEKR